LLTLIFLFLEKSRFYEVLLKISVAKKREAKILVKNILNLLLSVFLAKLK